MLQETMLEEELEKKISRRLFKGTGILKEKMNGGKKIQERFVYYFVTVAIAGRTKWHLYS